MIRDKALHESTSLFLFSSGFGTADVFQKEGEISLLRTNSAKPSASYLLYSERFIEGAPSDFRMTCHHY
jgi:hypothetical protein